MFLTQVFVLVACLGGYNVPQALLTGLFIDFYVGLVLTLILGPLGAFLLANSSDKNVTKIGFNALIIAYVVLPIDMLLIHIMYRCANSPDATNWADFNVNILVFILLLIIWWRDFLRNLLRK